MKAKVKLILKLYISTNPGVNFSVPARDGTLLSILIVSQGGDLNSMFHKGQEGQKQKPLNQCGLQQRQIISLHMIT